MSGDSAKEHARMAEEARREALEAEARARAQAEQMKADMLTGATGEETVRQLGLIYGGLIGIAVVMVQPLISAHSTPPPRCPSSRSRWPSRSSPRS